MRAKYPHFLSTNPSFVGLSFTDLIIVGVGLMSSLTFGLESLVGVALTLSLIVINKWVNKYFDIKGIWKSKTINTLDWITDISKMGDM